MTSKPIVSQHNETVVSLFRDTVSARGSASALRHEVDGAWTTLDWARYAHRAASFAAGLRNLGVRKGDHVVLLMRNRPEFHFADVGAMLIGAVSVSVYNSPSVERLADIMEDCSAVACVVDEPAFRDRVLAAAELRGLDPRVIAVHPGAEASERITDYAELLATPPLDLGACVQHVASSDTAVMLYTSGTSGRPKGVPLSHSNVVFAVRTFAQRSRVPLAGKRQLSYLPMAHIGERFATHYAHIASGSEVTCCPDMAHLHRVLAETHPHMLFGAPRMWELLHARVSGGLQEDPDAAAAFEPALRRRRAGVPEAGDEDAIRSVLARFGLDEILVAIVGSAPLPRHIHEFWLDCGLPLADYYGQTETTGMGSWDPHDITAGTVGRPLDGMNVRISPDGEIEVRGPAVFSGYFNDADKTGRSFTSDGWFRTGDSGSFDAAGNLVYGGRRNDVVVPTSGHNVNPSHIESALARHRLVSYICVVGTGRPHVGAVIVLDPDATTEWLASRSVQVPAGRRLEDVPEVRGEIDARIAEINADLPGAERLRTRVIVTDCWDLDSDVLTATGKMKRAGVAARYAGLIDAMYAREPLAAGQPDHA
ncbi:AMP-binding protein [Arthrobacter sp. I2-34]|uniref:AMP-binding protein n=1 Tax=Arthrobacter hankyongi TaxID=2904801 RepID=A0ABS9L3J9_9MICC|nr:AMP-binding protein [Arthrobacter hankyongi]MCG2621255.1 AMP-binding protein [Arthrobacter hankyongi]